MRAYDLTAGATDGYCGHWQDGEAVPAVAADFTKLGGKPPRERREDGKK